MRDDEGFTRRRLLAAAAAGLGAIVAGGVGAAELVDHGVLPGKSLLDRLDGACSTPVPPLRFAPVGPTVSGRFRSRARRTTVGYAVAYPPGHGPGDALPLIVMLHGFGGDHRSSFAGMQPAQGCALLVDEKPLAPMAMVTVDGGGGYWNPHPGDDPMGMVMDELIPLCQAMGLGNPPRGIATMGISMGGYGALLFAERFPERISAVAAISPAIWTSYDQARQANAGAYASAADFAACDAVTHARALSGIPVRVASGDSDPFHPGVVAFAEASPPSVQVVVGSGCHTGNFFTAQEVPSMAFLSAHLAA
ncbi:MAG: alpha/beta hydrolase [Acidobacteriota bacterium]|nr:alpha/beta hydrolase [Acidobacteriota bacterium]